MYRVVQRVPNAAEDSLWSLAWASQDVLIVGGMDACVRSLTRGDNGQLLEPKVLYQHKLSVLSLAVEDSQQLLASSSLDSAIHIWSLKENALVCSIEAGPTEIWSVAFSPDRRHIASGSCAGVISSWNYLKEGEKEDYVVEGGFPLSVAYSPNGQQIAAGTISGRVSVCDVESKKQLCRLDGHNMAVRSVCYSPDSSLLLSVSDDSLGRLYDVRAGPMEGSSENDVASLVSVFSGHSSWILSAAFAPNGLQFVTSSSDGTVKVWDVRKRELLTTLGGHSDAVWDVAYDFDGSYIASVSDDQSVQLYEVPPS